MQPCVELGKEWTFWQLINCDEPNSVKDKVAAVKTRSVLDLGCGNAIGLFLLYYVFGFQNIEGVDNESEGVLLERFKDEISEQLRERFMSVQSRFEAFHLDWKPGPLDAIQKPLTEQDYRRFITLTYCQAENYKPKKDEYGLIIMSDLLHYLDQEGWKKMFELITSRLAPDGLLYLRFKQQPLCGSYKPGCSYEQLVSACQIQFDEARFHSRLEPSEREGEVCVITNI